MSLCYNCQGKFEAKYLGRPKKIFHNWQDCIQTLVKCGYKVLREWDGSKCSNCGVKQ